MNLKSQCTGPSSCSGQLLSVPNNHKYQLSVNNNGQRSGGFTRTSDSNDESNQGVVIPSKLSRRNA